MKKKWNVIYYTTENGDCPVKDFINSRSINNKLKITTLIDYLQEMGINLPRPFSDLLRDGIHELRIKLSGNETRVMYFFCYENFIVLTHCFIKTAQKVPEYEINKAIKLREKFLNRFNIFSIKELVK